MKSIISILFFVILSIYSYSQNTVQNIRLNQIGFLPYTQKIAAVVDVSATQFDILDPKKQVVFTGKLSQQMEWAQSGEKVQIADFSTFTTPGTYTVRVTNYGESFPFEIGNSALHDVNNAIAKAFYFNRASIALEPQYAGKYARNEGHPDTIVYILPQAAGPKRKAGDIISTPKGWYDAGDYNKYIVNSGITVGTMLLAYENYSSYFDTVTWNIPESKNGIPDLIDEIRWNLDWMITMQDPDDGGVYTKTTDEHFCGMIMPDKATTTRYVVGKSTAAALDFAAVMALTYRVFQKLDKPFADSCLIAAKKAWDWAQLHPDIAFHNPLEEQGFPKITTGGYGDNSFTDEKTWAASELLIATLDPKYAPFIDLTKNMGIPWWQNVEGMCLYSLYNNRASIGKFIDVKKVTDKILEKANGFALYQEKDNPYKVAAVDFSWGSNGVLANQGIILLYAYNITNNINYYNAALASYDYLLGRNATQYSFITEYGEKCTKNLHHRPSEGDDIEGSIPGFLAGGPNGGNKRDCFGSYSDFPAKGYYDATCSYTTNEIAINWQAPCTYLAHALIAEYTNKLVPTNKNYVHALVKQIHCNRTEKQASFAVLSDTKWQVKTKDSWLKITNSSNTGNAFVQIEITELNNLETTRTGTIQILVEGKVIETIELFQKGRPKNFRIEAENYVRMNGIQQEYTTDEGGGLNVGWINNFDFMTYSIDIPQTGTYSLSYRVACFDNTGDFYLEMNDSIFSRTDVLPTGGWQNWTTIKDTAYFTEGIHEITLFAPKGGFNINYFDFVFITPKNIAPVHSQADLKKQYNDK